MFSIDPKLSTSIEELLDENIPFIKSNKKIEYANIPCVIDIESSSFYDTGEKRSCMYAFILGVNGKKIIGRTWIELWSYLDRISEFYGLGGDRRMIFYIHNLSYEFQWFRKWRNWISVFSTEKRCPLYALDDKGIEYRCSYQLSGYSLAKVGDNLVKYKTEKKVGDLDYSLIRHSKTPLTEKEIGYIIGDGDVVMCYIQEEIENHHNNISLLPLTKTGKIRSYVRRNCLYSGKHHDDYRKFKRYQNIMKHLPIVSLNEYEQLKRAFAGGFTHANGYYVGRISNNVHSFDFTSSYPAVMIAEKFPMEQGELITIKGKEDFERNMKLYCCLFDVTFINIESTFMFEHPISVSKCYRKINYSSDNGRLVMADEISITLTEQDYYIIRKFYKWDKMKVKNFRRYRKNYLPHDFVRSILYLYKKKTELKDVIDKVAEYMNSKEMLNSCFGMSVTDICRNETVYENGLWEDIPPNSEDELKKYNTKKNRFLCYQWGVWVTAYARRNLFTAIYELKEDYRYSDTDSVKFVNLEKHQKYFDNYNSKIVKKLEMAMDFHSFNMKDIRPKTIDGIEKIIGVWDYEGYYDQFKSLGAKRYMIHNKDGWSLTVSGVNKKIAIPYLYKKYDDHIIDKFEDGLIIPKGYTGKNIHTYIDEETSGDIVDYLGNKSTYHEMSSVHMEETSYELSLSREFIDYLFDIKDYESGDD